MTRKSNQQKGFRILNERTSLVKVDTVQPHPRNVNQSNLDAISESVKVNGFYGSLIVQKSTGHILAGTHRWHAAKANGAAEVPVTFIDVTDEEALRIMVADNQTTRLGKDDPEALADLLKDIVFECGSIEGTGFTTEELDKLVAAIQQEPLEDSGGKNLDEGDASELEAADVTVVVGEFRIVVSRDDYDRWLESMRSAVGFEKSSIIAEIRRRLDV